MHMSLQAAQRQRAIHLYRHGLKNLLSWAIRRDLFAQEVRVVVFQRIYSFKFQRYKHETGFITCLQAARLRAEFDLNKEMVRGSPKALRL